MNPEIPEERKYIEELTQKYIYLCEELDYKEKYKVKGKDIYDREEISEIGIESKNLYTAKKLLKRIKLLYEAIQEEITRIAVQYFLENNKKLTIYNCFKNKKYHFYFLELESFYRFINILQEEEPTLQGQLTLEKAYKNHEYTFLFKRATATYKTINGSKPEIIVQRKYLSQIRKLVEFYIKESNLTEYWFYPKSTGLLLEELLEGTYNNNNKEYELAKTKKKNSSKTPTRKTLEGARNIQENDQATQTIFPNTGLTQATQDYLLQHHTQLILETTTTRRNPRTNNLEIIGTPIITEAIGIILQTAFGQYTKIILLLENYKSEIVKELTTLETPRLKEYYKTALISISVNQGILEERIKEISIQNIEGEIVDKIIETLLYINNTKELLKPILLNLLENNLMNEEQNKTLKELRRFRFNWQPISTPIRRKKTKRYPQDKDILESRELIQITDDIWETVNNLINRINPTNNSRLGAILLTLKGIDAGEIKPFHQVKW
ncbi:hypothetical protein C2G38_2220524 [Gigaspora rosea]|uniref:Uncharacterized protein n=1 Tax=Gigaspora rosea TaxID=44941 RepID=A0A397U4C8_9GLOM|nr:hypothetical protein C2G38_2220524 [Gigaspora rosea]